MTNGTDIRLINKGVVLLGEKTSNLSIDSTINEYYGFRNTFKDNSNYSWSIDAEFILESDNSNLFNQLLLNNEKLQIEISVEIAPGENNVVYGYCTVESINSSYQMEALTTFNVTLTGNSEISFITDTNYTMPTLADEEPLLYYNNQNQLLVFDNRTSVNQTSVYRVFHRESTQLFNVLLRTIKQVEEDANYYYILGNNGTSDILNKYAKKGYNLIWSNTIGTECTHFRLDTTYDEYIYALEAQGDTIEIINRNSGADVDSYTLPDLASRCYLLPNSRFARAVNDLVYFYQINPPGSQSDTTFIVSRQVFITLTETVILFHLDSNSNLYIYKDGEFIYCYNITTTNIQAEKIGDFTPNTTAALTGSKNAFVYLYDDVGQLEIFKNGIQEEVTTCLGTALNKVVDVNGVIATTVVGINDSLIREVPEDYNFNLEEYL